MSKLIYFMSFNSTIQGLSEDKQFIGESLLSRLQDDDPSVVTCVLKLGQVENHVFICCFNRQFLSFGYHFQCKAGNNSLLSPKSL